MMKLSCFIFSIKLVFLPVILLLSLSCYLESAAQTSFANETDYSALLDFKNLIVEDPNQVMSSWNNSLHFCFWVGVTCNSSNGRVILLNLPSLSLAGSIPPSLGNLTYLAGIDLANNGLHGEIPQEMGRLLRLEKLTMSYNNLNGNIPTNLTHCTKLREFSVSYNQLVGRIPDQLNTLSKLEVLKLDANHLNGNIPAWIGNFSSLKVLSLIRNHFQSSIPDELGHLLNLGILQLYGNNLSGMIPSSIYNISSLYVLSVTQNQLYGQLPLDVGLKLPKLEFFVGAINSFTGTIPESLSNASRLQILDFSKNGLIGTIPGSLRSLKDLVRLNFEENSLSGDLSFLSDLANCTSLHVLGLRYNRFGGELPSSIANLSISLSALTMGGNAFHGSIPFGIGNLLELTLLGLEINNLSGSIPDVIGKFQKLEGLSLNQNKFSGSIPSSFGNLTKLSRLYLNDNELEGSIPSSLGNCTSLQDVDFARNMLDGTIPNQFIGLSSLTVALSMSHNSLTGSLPVEVGNLKNLMELDLSNNRLSGQIPSKLGNCIILEHLYLDHNMFDGILPQSLETLKGLISLNFSHNNLSGQIPEFLVNFSSLRHLDLSYNNFQGEVPHEGIFANASSVSINGNDNLCGGITELLLQTCSKKGDRKHASAKLIIIATVLAIFVFGVLCCLATFYVLKTKRRKSTAPSSEKRLLDLSYQELRRSTNGFSMENLIGSGSFGSVFMGILPSGDRKSIAIKVINLKQQGALESFIDECNALRSIRHRNLLKVITACSSIDHQGHEFRALVFEFMSNGNLDQWLHPLTDVQYQDKKLSLTRRLDIAIDVASALDYLHHHCDTPIVHCDLKPSNVLLDEDMIAHVGDFGLTRFLSEASENRTISATLKGSIGYIPPEYGMGSKISVQGDMYSYGILLLEIFTGKRPTDKMFKNNISIQKFVAMALPEHVIRVADPTMLVEGGNYDELEGLDNIDEKAIYSQYKTKGSTRSEVAECLVSIMGIGLSCSATSPGNRMSMDVVVNKLSTIRSSFLLSASSNQNNI